MDITHLEFFKVVAQQLEVLVVPGERVAGPRALDARGERIGTSLKETVM